jgi:hypothetical protein
MTNEWGMVGEQPGAVSAVYSLSLVVDLIFYQ